MVGAAAVADSAEAALRAGGNMNANCMTEEFKAVEDKITELEKQSSVEFVPVFLEQADGYTALRQSYFWFSYVVVLFILQSCLAAELLIWTYALALPVSFAVFALSSKSWALRLLVPKAYQQHKVEETALKVFAQEEVFATRDRTGVLILISKMEKSVFILGDKGLNSKVDPKEWSDLGQSLAKDFDQHRSGDSFLKALDGLIQRLKSDFPPRNDDSNELHNKVRRRDS